MWINVKDFPYSVKGDGTTDDTLAIQRAIDAAQEWPQTVPPSPDGRNVVYFPLGIYRTTATLELFQNQGVRFIGLGNVAGLPAYAGGSQFRQSGAVLFWDGDPGGTLLRIKGSYDGTIENLCFVGATPQKYKFDTGTSSADPGESFVRFNNGLFASITQIYVNVVNFYKVGISGWLDGLDAGTSGAVDRDAPDADPTARASPWPGEPCPGHRAARKTWSGSCEVGRRVPRTCAARERPKISLDKGRPVEIALAMSGRSVAQCGPRWPPYNTFHAAQPQRSVYVSALHLCATGLSFPRKSSLQSTG